MEACRAGVLAHLSTVVSMILSSLLTSVPSGALIESTPIHLGARKERCEAQMRARMLCKGSTAYSQYFARTRIDIGFMELGISVQRTGAAPHVAHRWARRAHLGQRAPRGILPLCADGWMGHRFW